MGQPCTRGHSVGCLPIHLLFLTSRKSCRAGCQGTCRRSLCEGKSEKDPPPHPYWEILSRSLLKHFANNEKELGDQGITLIQIFDKIRKTGILETIRKSAVGFKGVLKRTRVRSFLLSLIQETFSLIIVPRTLKYNVTCKGL